MTSPFPWNLSGIEEVTAVLGVPEMEEPEARRAEEALGPATVFRKRRDGCLQPLFPGVNELDQISKIHDVIGTPAQKTLTKFKQSRAMNFDFPFKRGSGIPLLTTNLSPQCLSLLHAMVAYDPDERIAAHQALQHPYFQEQRKTEERAVGSHRKACFPEHPVAPEPLSNSCWISKEGRKQGKAFDVQLASVLFQETVPKARGGPSQETRTGLRHGTAQTKAFGSGQTVLLLQPHAAVRAWIWDTWKSAGAETLEVHPCEQEDRSAEGP
ncbi:PREDICTED: MAPK/MAK/MRK overlapping kinase-like isoform X5 [Rhinopithecus bieti]|uniref:MAPK/MAK/MRK overlapping kinase-like isoform X5 n=1 Tax=Rhinopithecus bieti TaxID=61621 RepID=UPI00083BD89D|nr:PREDICTED: MAPK/MAK/MRK overlapping kinase-like isoform X5 [Rhinopithecus bieti]